MGIKNKKTIKNISKSKSAIDTSQTENVIKTEDGFKIMDCMSIPKDDSDISDAFSSDDEQESMIPAEVQSVVEKKIDETEDGFKIVSSVPNDDSDISDAFESDIDEEEWFINKAKRKKSEVNMKVDSKISKPNSILHAKIPHALQRKIKKPLQRIMNDFGLTQSTMEKSTVKTITKIENVSNQTLAGSLRVLPPVEVMDYSQRGKRRRSKLKNTDEKDDDPYADMKSFVKISRHDVYKLGVEGMEGADKKDAKVALAMKLGAKPRRKKGVNYKVYQAEKKITDAQFKEKEEEQRRNGFKVKKKDIRKKNSAEDTSSGLSMGKFKDGVLKLSKSDIRKIKQT